MGRQRPHHKPTDQTRKLVGDLTLHGQSQEDIAKRLSISVETLVKHYPYEIYELKHDVTCEIENIALQKARSGDWKAIKFWLQCRGGWAAARTVEEQQQAENEKSLIEKLLNTTATDGSKNNQSTT